MHNGFGNSDPLPGMKEEYNSYKEAEEVYSKEIHDLEEIFSEAFRTKKALEATLASKEPTEKAREEISTELKIVTERMYKARDRMHILSAKIAKLRSNDELANKVLEIQELNKDFGSPDYHEN